MPTEEKPNVETRTCYIAWEKHWTPKPCPECGDTATAHGFLSFEEFGPENTKAFAHVYMHATERDDCVVYGPKHLPSQS